MPQKVFIILKKIFFVDQFYENKRGKKDENTTKKS